MVRTRSGAGKRATAAGRSGPRARKSGAPKSPGLRKPKPTRSAPRKRKLSPVSETAKLKEQLKEVLQQQAATSDILAAINGSGGNLAPVFECILEKAHQLCGAPCGSLQLYRDGRVVPVAIRGMTPAFAEFLRGGYPITERARSVLFTDRPMHRLDLVEVLKELPDELSFRAAVELGGIRTMTSVPLVRNGVAFGRIIAARQEVRAFDDKQISTLQGFAAQAVIAIENARLLQELRARTDDLAESLQQQTATSEVLKVISRSAFDLKSVLTTLTESAKSLCGGSLGIICLREGEVMRLKAESGCTPAFVDFMHAHPIKPGRETITGRVFMDGKPVHVADVQQDREYSFGNAPVIGAYRAVLAVPLMRGGAVEGVLLLGRPEPGPFSQRQLELVQTFADQAVIAIENTRLFNETQAKTRDLEEALTHQTGSANILRVIASSPTSVEPVLEAIAESARELCEAADAVVLLKEGDYLRFSAHSGPIPVTVDKRPIGPGWTAGLAFLNQKPVHVHDMLSEQGAQFPDARAMGQSTGEIIRTVLSVPLLRERESIGAILLRRTEMRPFNEKQVNLLATFADQAVIAIQNARLFNETQEALERQTATADILKVIASSPSDVQPVFEAIATRANSLVGGFSATVFRFIGGMAHLMAFTPTTPEADEILKSTFPSPVESFAPFQMARDGEVTQVPDTEALKDEILAISRARGFRSMVFAPLMNKGASIGLIAVTRVQPGAFSDHHVQLLRTFADQAVIAIENVRLFDEVQAKTRDLEESLQQQTATADVLKVISRSAFDLASVMNTLAHSAGELCKAEISALYLREDDVLVARGVAYADTAQADFLRATTLEANSSTYIGRALLAGLVRNIADVSNETEIGHLNKFAAILNFKSILFVPLMREGRGIGVFALARKRIRQFSQREVELVQTFADQAVIAIENARLFDEVQARTKELSLSLEELRAAQDRLVQTEKLASLGQLTAGIAHEIKNPLNFVNNFSSLSTELIDELNDTLKDVALDGKTREEVDELGAMLKGNLEKVVQHGKRADSIVKNMLLHSREGAGEHRPADINAIVEESLNLAYHGARAEKSGFNITLRRDLDPAAGMIDLYPQEITRVFLNLISNGFYAANKRKEAGGDGFEPSLTATTKNLGNRVEIRIRDNGTGIPTEVKEKMFNPFFTTKPAGEGTGLGLSMSHDIVVKQHGGKIEVETEPGQFTEFIITLPRAAAQNQAGDRY